MGCALVLVFATPSAILATVLLLPTAMAWVADRQPGHPTARAVLLFGLAASCQPLNLLWRAGDQLGDAILLGSDIHGLAVAWAAQAGGWLLTQTVPLALGRLADAKANVVLGRLRRRQADLLEEWRPDA